VRTAEINRIISDIASRHHSLIRSDVASAAGIDPRWLRDRVASGQLEHVDRELFRVAGAPRGWHERALAAVWAQGPTGLLSHRAAALLHRIDGIEAAPFEVLTERWARRRRRSGVRVHETNLLLPADRTMREGIPCTSVVRTVIDLAGVVPPYRADQALEDVLRSKWCDVQDVADRFVKLSGRGRPGTRVMRTLLEKRIGRDVPTKTEFERRVLELTRKARLALPDCQVKVPLDDRPAYIDLGWPDRLLGVECDGLYDHGSSIRLPWDDDRQNQLQLRGWLILRFTWHMLTKQPDVVIAQLRAAFALRPPRDHA
jgi:very-short-patch-repair endonuclease